MKKKLGFTLIEVLAIITIIGVLAVLVIPQVKTSLYAKKQKQYENLISTIKSAAKIYRNDNGKRQMIGVDTLIKNDYLTEMTNPLDNSRISGCVKIINNGSGVDQYEYVSDVNECSSNYSELIVNLGGGSTAQVFMKEYDAGTHLQLVNPTRNDYKFSGWTVVGENAEIINNNELIIGEMVTVVTATWRPNYECTPETTCTELIVNLGGGNTTQEFISGYIAGTHLRLVDPTRTNYEFKYWTVEGENARIANDNELIIGNNVTTITAKWESLIKNKITYNCNGGSGTMPSTIYEEGEQPRLTLNTCYKNATPGARGTGMVYCFKGWALSPTGAVAYADNAVFTNSDNIKDITLYAVWGNAFTASGSYNVLNDGNGKWRIKFTGNGNFIPTCAMSIDAFLVGGGGGGGRSTFTSGDQAGGGGGYAKTFSNISLSASATCNITIGQGGATNTAGGTTYFRTPQTTYSVPGGNPGGEASGGDGGSYGYTVRGGAGGSGGGGCNGCTPYRGGSDGSNGTGYGGTGQDNVTGYPKTTREFGESTGTLYSGGGTGQSGYGCNGSSGGDGGGGGACADGVANTGGGGGGRRAGGSGIVVIRDHR